LRANGTGPACGPVFIAASHPASVVRSAVSSLQPSLEQSLAVVAVQTALAQEEKCVGAQNARSAEQIATAEAHSDSAQADCSVVLTADDWTLGEDKDLPSVDDSIRADWAPDDWARADYLAKVGRGVPLHFLVARPEHSPMAERPLDSVEDRKETLPLWPV